MQHIKHKVFIVVPEFEFMAEITCCPDCGSTEGNECHYCCSHASTEVKTVQEGYKGRYLREICECTVCGYYEVINEMDYWAEFPCL